MPKDRLNFIMGNPPFVGVQHMDKTQKSDLVGLFAKNKNRGIGFCRKLVFENHKKFLCGQNFPDS